MTAEDIQDAEYCLFKIGRFGTGEKHVGKLVNGQLVMCCRMFGGVGRSANRKPPYVIPGGKPEEATCRWCKPQVG